MSAAPRSIDCREAVERLYEYLDQELTPEVRAEVEHHLRSCAGCFRHFEFERAFLRFLEARARGRGAGPEVKQRILRELFGPEEA
ncbi:MAG: zf-HC2 domain-containing protein [Gemmatimonadetes bacterium]|nr:zf-HC2 domain-containing protein [Gemmatimonadota bacterium]MBI2537912.1 zf-HC2 domain-containing protein [Gemmatimonadota bacterium]